MNDLKERLEKWASEDVSPDELFKSVRTARAMLSLLWPVIEAFVKTFPDGTAVNCTYDCHFEGRHPKCPECQALAQLEKELEK